MVQSLADSFGQVAAYERPDYRYASVSNLFYQNVIRPVQEQAAAIQAQTMALIQPDMIRPLDTFDAFQAVPPCMQFPIMLHAPLVRLLEQGRIDGFGHDPQFLRWCLDNGHDVYGRMIDNGLVRDIAAAPRNDDGSVTFSWHVSSEDPILSFEQIEAIESTRDMIDRMLADTNFDPTAYPSERG